MFDPHHIGPQSSSFYSRNKGRVLQRKLVNPPPSIITSRDLDNYYKILQHNGRIPPTPTVQDLIINYPNIQLTKPYSLAKDSILSVKIDLYAVMIYPDNQQLSIPFSNFPQYSETVYLDSTHYYMSIYYRIVNLGGVQFYCIYVNFFNNSSSLVLDDSYYYYVYDFGTEQPLTTDKLYSFFITQSNYVAFGVKDFNYSQGNSSAIYLPLSNWTIVR